jgi:hypothetical protein
MDYSERFLARTAKIGEDEEAQLAARMLQDVPLYRRWEHSHGLLMQAVAAPSRATAKITELRRVTFLTLHRKAPFEYLRDRHITGPARRRLIRVLFGTHDYAKCLVREHHAYLSAACSFMCADALSGDVVRDGAFCDAVAKYEEAYTEYYRAYGDSLLAEQSGETASVQSLLPYLRYQLKVIREHMLAGAPETSDFSALQAMYQATGDTQKLPTMRQP